MQYFAHVDLEILILFQYLHNSQGLLESCPSLSLPLELSPHVLLGLQGATTARGCCITSPALPSIMTPRFSCSPSASQHTLASLTCKAQVSQIVPLLRAIMECIWRKEASGEEKPRASFLLQLGFQHPPDGCSETRRIPRNA